jgi:hypothetical protein
VSVLEELIRGSLKVASVTEKMRSNKLAWYGHVMRRDESHIIKRVMTMNVDGHPSRVRSRKRWMDCVKDDLKIKGVSMEMTSDRREWKKWCGRLGGISEMPVLSFQGAQA